MMSERGLFTTMQTYHGFVKFGNQGKLLVQGRGDIKVRLSQRIQIMKHILYVLGISVNLLSIAALDWRGIVRLAYG